MFHRLPPEKEVNLFNVITNVIARLENNPDNKMCFIHDATEDEKQSYTNKWESEKHQSRIRDQSGSNPKIIRKESGKESGAILKMKVNDKGIRVNPQDES